MSLYIEAATILSSTDSETGSLKSIIYGEGRSRNGSTTNRKSAPASLYALIIEAAKWDTVLKEVIENAGLLKLEHKLTPLLALLLVHDLLLSKHGIAAPSKHPLRIAVERNKARLQAEFTKARIKRRCPSVDELKKTVLREKDGSENGEHKNIHPRWVRLNTIRSSSKDLLESSFSRFGHVGSLKDLRAEDVLFMDENVPGLIALPPTTDLTKTSAYRDGQIIFQDKASCFPAYLLLQSDPTTPIRDVMDACAAPGNKTTHLAAILNATSHPGDCQLFACERDPTRSRTLQKMVDLAGAGDMVNIYAKQDFLALDPDDPTFSKVTHLLLDPSCSGSGILGREDIPRLALPSDPKSLSNGSDSKSKKRKRGSDTSPPAKSPRAAEDPDMLDTETSDHTDRLTRLSALQLRIIEHAFSFPSARRVTYSTCSIHVEENESVVARALQSKVARDRGWKVLPKNRHPEGLKKWSHRGINGAHDLNNTQMEGCIRCYPNDEYGTMGFFVCAFERDESNDMENGKGSGRHRDRAYDVETDLLQPDEEGQEDESEEEWGGISDET